MKRINNIKKLLQPTALLVLLGLSANGLAEEFVHGKACSPLEYDDDSAMGNFVPVNRKFYSADEKLVHIFKSNCLFYKVHPLKAEITEQFFLNFVAEDMTGAEISSYQQELADYIEQGVLTLPLAEFDAGNAQLTVKSLYGEIEANIVESGLEVRAMKQTLLSIEQLL